MPKNWSAADAQLLKRLREAAGMSPDVLAKRHTLSTAQVRELEGQDNGRFYTEDIKAYAGHRLLLALGHLPSDSAASRVQPQPRAVATAPAAVPVAASPSEVKAVDTDQSRAPLPGAAATEQAPVGRLRPSTPAHETPEFPAPTPSAGAKPVTASAAETASGAGRAWLGWLLLAALGLVAWLLLQAPGRKPASVEEASSPPPVAAAEPSPPAAAAETAPSTPAVPVVPPASAVAEANPAAPMSCDLPKVSNPVAYKSPVANKPATYLYVESRTDVQVCISDARGTETNLRLAAGQSRNVPGVPPYTVRTSDWGQTRVFFQGALVRWDSPVPPESLQLLPYSAD